MSKPQSSPRKPWRPSGKAAKTLTKKVLPTKSTVVVRRDKFRSNTLNRGLPVHYHTRTSLEPASARTAEVPCLCQRVLPPFAATPSTAPTLSEPLQIDQLCQSTSVFSHFHSFVFCCSAESSTRKVRIHEQTRPFSALF